MSQFSDGLRSELKRLGLSQVQACSKAWPGDFAGPKRIARWVNGKNDPSVMDAYQLVVAIGTTFDAVMAAGAKPDWTSAAAERVSEGGRVVRQRAQTSLRQGHEDPAKGRKGR